MFCCDSGYCLSFQLVCDGKPDCDDSSEEAHCELIIFPQAYNYSFDKPPVRLRRKKNITYLNPLDVELDLTILEVLDVNEVHHEIEISFLLDAGLDLV